MSMREPKVTAPQWDDTTLETTMGSLLRLGVIISASIVAFGGLLYLLHFGARPRPVQVSPGPSMTSPSPELTASGAQDIGARATPNWPGATSSTV